MDGALPPIFEYEPLTFEWTDRDLVLLERLRQSNGADVLRAKVRRGQRVLQATQYVGVIRLGNRTVQVLPKMYRSRQDTDAQRREATLNLLHLLRYATDVPIREQDVTPLLDQRMDWFELLTRLFTVHLMDEWRRGAFRTYHLVQETSPVLKGTWLIADQLRHPCRNHLFEVAYDEFTGDNALNRIFRFVVERLWILTRDGANRQLLGELRHWMEDVSLVPAVTVAQATDTLITRLNQRFEPLLNLARLFLAQSAPQLAVGEQSLFAFVFDMNALFEAFVARFLIRHRDDILPPSLRACDILPQARGVRCHLVWKKHTEHVLLRPDIAFRASDDGFPLLIDTKYKGLNVNDAMDGVSESDIYQMYAYAHRYDCPRVLLLYPQTAELRAPIYQEYGLAHTNKRIVVATVDIRADLGASWGREAIAHNLSTILGRLEGIDDGTGQGLAS